MWLKARVVHLLNALNSFHQKGIPIHEKSASPEYLSLNLFIYLFEI